MFGVTDLLQFLICWYVLQVYHFLLKQVFVHFHFYMYIKYS